MFKYLCITLLLLTAAHAEDMPPQAVILTKVTAGSLQNQKLSVGTFTPYNDVMMKAEIAGCIAAAFVKEGQSVKEGQKLFALRAHEAEAKVKKAQAHVKMMRNALDRKRKLYAKDFISQHDIEKSEADVESAEADLVFAKEEYHKTQICAPFSGVLSMKKASKGTYVSPNQELIRVQDTDPIRLIFQIPQKEISFFKVGDAVVAKTDVYPGKTFPGTIEAIDASINEASRSVTVYAAFKNPDHLLIPGMYGEIYPAASTAKSVLLIPEQALVSQESGPHVYKKVKDKAVLTKVTLGIRTADKAEVLGGLQAGDEIVLEGQTKLFPNAAIIGTYDVHH